MKNPRALPALVGFASGIVFAAGLALSGMVDPGRVLGFLDLAGAWDPSLIWVMGGAVLTHFAWLRLSSRPGAADGAQRGVARRVDGRLLLGSALFGVGWGMSGYCPGPALVALGLARAEAAVFVAAMLVGIVIYGVVARPALVEQGTAAE